MFKFLLITVFLATALAVEFEFKNLDSQDIWVGILGNANKAPLENGGFALGAGQSRTVQSPDDWAGRFWARTWCDAETNHCLTGNCGDHLECGGAGGDTPVSLAEITLGDLAWYDISLVDGFNIPLSFGPVDGEGDGSEYSCKTPTCAYHFNDDCPDELKMNSDEHGVVACKSACTAFGTDSYCCRGDFNTPETCDSSDWPVDYPTYFKSHCPDAYSYAYDDRKSTYTCSHATKYIVTFGG